MSLTVGLAQLTRNTLWGAVTSERCWACVRDDHKHIVDPKDQAHALSPIFPDQRGDEGVKQVASRADPEMCHGKPEPVWAAVIILNHDSKHLLLTTRSAPIRLAPALPVTVPAKTMS
jgi:hypothetical protein